MTRIWPVFVIAFLYGGYSYQSYSCYGGAAWSGPGLGVAWRMTGRKRSWLRAQLPLAVLTLAPFGAWVACKSAFDDGSGASFLAHLVIYAVLLPLTFSVLDIYAEALRVPTCWNRQEDSTRYGAG